MNKRELASITRSLMRVTGILPNSLIIDQKLAHTQFGINRVKNDEGDWLEWSEKDQCFMPEVK